jgi:alkylhydroperoxidase family enzyme
MRTILALSVGIAALAVCLDSASAQSDSMSPPRFPALGTDDAWKQLRGENPPLPAWALALAQPLPRTTGAMLHLDYVHRAKNPLGPVLAGKLRWAAADAMACDYGKRYAEADLRRAGLKDNDLKKLAGDLKGLSEPDRAAVAFARKMTRAAHRVSDAEVAELLKQFGPDKVVAMVHTLAHANFQNRIFLALNVEVEPDGPLPPLDPHLDTVRQAKLATPARPPWKEVQTASAPAGTFARPDWGKQTFAELATALDQQKSRKSRIPLPDPSRLADLPPEAKTLATKIVWTNISMGYQPLLTRTWFDTMRTFQQESKLDLVFANSMFWVITRSNECFY